MNSLQKKYNDWRDKDRGHDNFLIQNNLTVETGNDLLIGYVKLRTKKEKGTTKNTK